MQELIDQVSEIIARSKYIVAFTGAGISTESGIPDFRSTEGIWTKYDPYEYGSYEGFLEDPSKYWTMAKETRKIIAEAKPNYGHKALATLEREYGKLKSVITQNVDFLHTKAGNSKVLELHGSYQRNFCLECEVEFSIDDVMTQMESNIIPPKCECGGVIRSSSILFGEPPPAKVLLEAKREIQKCDCLIVIGTSLRVTPAASMPLLAAAQGSTVIIINNEPTNSDYIAKVVIRGNAGLVMTEIIDRLKKIDVESLSISTLQNMTKKEGLRPVTHVTKRAEEQLLTEGIDNLLNDEEQSQVAIHYFSILDKIERNFQDKNFELEEKNIKILGRNRRILNQKKQIIIEDLSLDNLLNNFSEGFILASLTSAIRETEANVKSFVEYQKLVEKIKKWPDIGFSSYSIEKAWGEVIKGIEEINDWLMNKKDEYFPIIRELIKQNNNTNNAIFTHLGTYYTNKEIFYAITNTITINPYLNEKIKVYLKDSEKITYEELRERLINLLRFLSTNTSDTKMQQMVNLFLSQPEFE